MLITQTRKPPSTLCPGPLVPGSRRVHICHDRPQMAPGSDRHAIGSGVVPTVPSVTLPLRCGFSGKRLVDIALSLTGLVICLLPGLLIAVLIKASSRGPVLFWSDRVGRDNTLFRMPKFRTMVADAPLIASPAFAEAARHVTPLGRILRRTSLDELPQLWSILRGDMSIVGPRPALFSETRLIALRTQAGVHRLTPGLTGLAQVSGRNLLSEQDKVFWDTAYLRGWSLRLDTAIIGRTVAVVLTGYGVSH